MLLEADDSQLVLIDYQGRLMPAIHDHAFVLANARKLAEFAKLVGVPVWATEQNPTSLGPTDPSLAPLCDGIVTKMDFSGAEELQAVLVPPAPPPRTGGNVRSLPRHLQKPATAEPERSTLVLAGCEAHVCLLQTALMLLDSGSDVWVVTDACGSRIERNRDAAYDRLAGAGAELVTTEMVAFEWLRDAAHPAWPEVLELIK